MTPCIYIYILCFSVCLFVCPFVCNKRQNGWTDRAKILYGTSHDPRKCAQNYKICIQKFLSFIKFWKCAKKNTINYPRTFLLLFYIVALWWKTWPTFICVSSSPNSFLANLASSAVLSAFIRSAIFILKGTVNVILNAPLLQFLFTAQIHIEHSEGFEDFQKKQLWELDYNNFSSLIGYIAVHFWLV